MRLLAGYEKVLKEEKKRHLSRQTSVLHFCKSPSGTHASPLVLLEIGDDSDDPPTAQEEVTPP
jgi:hypothetical protein